MARAVNILLVEDNDGDAFLFRSSVKRLQCSISHVRNAQSAIQRLEADQSLPHLIVLDLGLPGMTATEFLSWKCTKAKKEIQCIPTVIYTGSPFLRDGPPNGVKGTFYKSSSPEEIRSIVERMCAFVESP